MATERRGSLQGLSTAASVSPAIAGIAGISAGDRTLLAVDVVGNKSATIAVADAGAAWTIHVNRYQATQNATFLIASKVYAPGDGNPTVSWTGAAAYGYGALVAYSTLLGTIGITLSTVNDDYSFGDNNLPFNPVVMGNVANLVAALGFTYNTAGLPTGPAGYTAFYSSGSIGSNVVPAFYYKNDAGADPETPGDIVYAAGITGGSEYTVAFTESAPPGGADERRRRR